MPAAVVTDGPPPSLGGPCSYVLLCRHRASEIGPRRRAFRPSAGVPRGTEPAVRAHQRADPSQRRADPAHERIIGPGPRKCRTERRRRLRTPCRCGLPTADQRLSSRGPRFATARGTAGGAAAPDGSVHLFRNFQRMVTSTVGYQLTAAERKTYERYARLALPRHTSYPIASAWTTDYGPGDLREDLGHSARQGRPLSLYVHIPYCERLCYYCACTKEIVPEGKRRDLDPSAGLLAGLEREADRFAEVVGDNPVRQVHLGAAPPPSCGRRTCAASGRFCETASPSSRTPRSLSKWTHASRPTSTWSSCGSWPSPA